MPVVFPSILNVEEVSSGILLKNSHVPTIAQVEHIACARPSAMKGGVVGNARPMTNKHVPTITKVKHMAWAGSFYLGDRGNWQRCFLKE